MRRASFGVNVESSHDELLEQKKLLPSFVLWGSVLASLAVRRLLLTAVDVNLAAGRFDKMAQTEPSTRLEIFMSSSS